MNTVGNGANLEPFYTRGVCLPLSGQPLTHDYKLPDLGMSYPPTFPLGMSSVASFARPAICKTSDATGPRGWRLGRSAQARGTRMVAEQAGLDPHVSPGEWTIARLCTISAQVTWQQGGVAQSRRRHPATIKPAKSALWCSPLRSSVLHYWRPFTLTWATKRRRGAQRGPSSCAVVRGVVALLLLFI